ncbi:MAG: hypothetical protein QOF56_4341 [Acidobacteriaceae bacterium]|jgi:hypothetical protein|nr:hypothetical protein [Acidobacteriaceae bacterium]
MNLWQGCCNHTGMLRSSRSPIVPLATLAALLLIILMSGCASTNLDDSDPFKYNPNTGYPYIGGPFGRE